MIENEELTTATIDAEQQDASEGEGIGTATYSPEDNKIRIYPRARLSAEDYARVKAAGFAWAPKQEIFVAPSWSPSREDLARQMCGTIEDEDTSLVDRAEAKADRLEDLSDRKQNEAERARAGVASIADNIPFGQPILVGHHSERRARKDIQRIENGMRKAVEYWKAAGYWKERAAAAVRLAKYKERPDVRFRRIKGLEAEVRRLQAEYTPKDSQIIMQSKGWSAPPDAPKVPHCWTSNGSRGGRWVAVEDLPAIERGNRRWIEHLENRIAYERAMLEDAGGLVAEKHDIQVGGRVLVGGEWVAVLRVNRKGAEVVSVTTNRRYVPVCGIEEVKGYEAPSEEAAAAMAAAMKKPPLCNYPREDFATCTQAEWDAIPSDYKSTTRRIEETATEGAHRVRVALAHRVHLPASELNKAANVRYSYPFVYITDAKRKDPPAKGGAPEPKAAPQVAETLNESTADLFRPIADLDSIRERAERLKAHSNAREASAAAAAPFEAMQEALKTGVQVVSVNQLFPTPPELAARMVQDAGDIGEVDLRILEPSAGTGAILDAIYAETKAIGRGLSHVVAVEINRTLADKLTTHATKPTVICSDFLDAAGCSPEALFDLVLMNPPFENASDIRHIRHALKFLKPGGRLVAICANGTRQREALKPLAEASGGFWEDLPAGTFKAQGTGVNTALVVINA